MQRIAAFFHHFLIPQEKNQYKARMLHLDALSAYLVVMIALVIGVKYFSFSNVLGFATDITVERLYELTNETRLSHGLSSLSYNSQLAEAARAKAKDMFAKNYWAHFGPNGETPWQFMVGTGYKYQFAGENLAKNFLISQGVIDAWMNSPTHRENLLRSQYQEVGFAIENGVLNGEQTTLVVQMFGTPLTNSVDTVQNRQAPPIIEQKESLPASAPVQGIETTRSKSFITLPVIGNIQLILIGFLGLALLIDFIFASRLSIVHLGGKHIAHFIFVFIIAVGFAFILRGGAVP